MIDNRVASAAETVGEIADGGTIMIGGFGEAGSPIEFVHALIGHGASTAPLRSASSTTGRHSARVDSSRPSSAPAPSKTGSSSW